MGDNNYSGLGTVAAWDNAVGQYFALFIHYPITSSSIYSPGSALNRFFSALGNHDWDAGGYTDYWFSSDWWGRNRQLTLFDQDL